MSTYAHISAAAADLVDERMTTAFESAEALALSTGEVALILGFSEFDDRALVELSTSAARKLAKRLTEAADAAEEADKVARRRTALASQRARLEAQLAALAEREANL